MNDFKPRLGFRQGLGITVFLWLWGVSSGCATSGYGAAAYEGRRLPYVLEGKDRIYGFFFATNRDSSGVTDSSAPYGSTVGTVTRVGEFRIRLRQDVSVTGSRPGGWTGVELESIDASNENAFFDRLTQAIAASPDRSLLVVVFGYKESLQSSARKAGVFAYRVDVNTPVLLFDWPGDQPVTVGGYHRAFSYARRSGADLGDLLMRISRDVRPDNLWVTGNSMGAQVICDAFSHMTEDPGFSDRDHEISHVLLAAPDVARHEFDDRFRRELDALSDQLTVYVSSDDSALLLSRWLHGVPRLGRSSPVEPEQLEELEDLLALRAAGADDLSVIDFTPVNRASHGHNYYIESPEYFDDFYQRIQDTPPIVGRRLQRIAYEKGTSHWILWSDRE